MAWVFNPFTGQLDQTGASDVSGPSSSTDNAIARYDGTTGKLLQDSLVTISDVGAVAGATILQVDDITIDNGTVGSSSTLNLFGDDAFLTGNISDCTVTAVEDLNLLALTGTALLRSGTGQDLTINKNSGNLVLTGLTSGLLQVDGSSVVSTVAASSLSVIGAAEDGSYTDGLFTDFTSSTPIGTAIDRINEVLVGLAPPPAPDQDNISTTDSGTAGNLSFGASHAIATYTTVGTAAGGAAIDVNGTFVNSGQRKGIFTSSNVFNGVLNDDVTAHAYSYPADSFGNGNVGTLYLEVNGSNVHSVDLTSFGSGSTVNGNGSGFNLSAATPVEFPDASPFSLFQYRTGTYTIAAAEQRNGHNYCRVIHDTGATLNSNYFEWVVDADATATTYTSQSISGLSMTGSSFLSGVQYHTGGSATFNTTINNHHRNTYSSSASAITFPTTTNCSVSSLAVNSISSPNWEAQTQVLAQTITVDTGRLLDVDIAVSCATDRTVQSDVTSSTVNGGYELLLDSNISGASGQTDVAEPFVAEGYRQLSNLSLTSVSYSSGPQNGPSDWDSTVSLVSGTAGYDGLLVYNDALRYPTQGANSGNFGAVTNGPASNPNYSAASGTRTYLRYFFVGSGKQNFTLALTVASTSFVSVATGPSSNNLTLEILAPNTTQNGSATVEFKDAVTAYTDDNSIGCFASTYGATIPTSWGITLGTRSTATSGSVIVVRIKAAAAWSGNISNMTVTVL